MKRAPREINVFSISAIDLFCSAMGTFMILTFIVLPYYKKQGSNPLLEENKTLITKIESLSQRTITQDSQLDTLKEEIVHLQRTISDLSVLKNELEIQQDSTQKGNADLIMKNVELTSRIDILQKQLAALQVDIAKVEPNSRGKQVSPGDDILSQNTTLKIENDDLQYRLGSLETEYQELLKRNEVLQSEKASFQAKIDSFMGQNANLKGDVDNLNKQVSALRPKDLEIVFVIDTTSSMSDQIEDLKDNIDSIIVVLQRVSRNLRLGIVEYKDHEDRTPVNSFPLSAIPSMRTGSNAPAILASIRLFLSKFEAEPTNRNVDIPEAVELGLAAAIQNEWSRISSNDEDTIQMILIVGDAPAKGPFVEKAFALARDWHDGNPNRVVNTVYVGPIGSAIGTQTFFKTLAQEGGGKYSTAQYKLIGNILDSVLYGL